MDFKDLFCGLFSKDDGMQTAYVFAKPHANTPAVRTKIKAKFADMGIHIKSEGEISGEMIDKKGFIDQHYYAIASKATIMKPKELNVPVDKFKEAFGEDWATVLAEDRAFNAMDVQGKLGIDAAALDEAWSKAKDAKKLVKFGGGFYCGLVDAEKKIYTVRPSQCTTQTARTHTHAPTLLAKPGWPYPADPLDHAHRRCSSTPSSWRCAGGSPPQVPLSTTLSLALIHRP